MTNVKDLPQTFTNLEGSLILCPVLGLSLNGVWTLYGLSLRQQKIKDIYWSTRIISPNGFKRNHWQISETWMPRNLFGRILSLDLKSLIHLSRTMDFSSTVKPFGDIAETWA